MTKRAIKAQITNRCRPDNAMFGWFLSSLRGPASAPAVDLIGGYGSNPGGLSAPVLSGRLRREGDIRGASRDGQLSAEQPPVVRWDVNSGARFIFAETFEWVMLPATT
jgi:hypothetical protein